MESIEDIRSTAEIISLAMTVPTVILGMGVLYIWGPSAMRSIREGSMNAQGWFIVGVTCAFLGSILDNLYWSLPWTASYLGLDETDALMKNGVFFNIVFRQAAGIAAAYCHLRAAAVSHKRSAIMTNRLMAASNLFAILVAAVLWYLG